MPSLNTGVGRRGCAYHDGNMNGQTYDSNGQPCATLSKEDKAYVAAASVFCVSVLLILGTIYLVRFLRARKKSQRSQEIPTRPMSHLGSPLIRPSTRVPVSPSPIQPPRRPTLSPLASQGMLPLPSESSHSSHSSHHTHESLGVQSTHSSRSPSPYSPNSENGSFTFPILSADGHLLPPPSRRTEPRPLPLAPAPVASALPFQTTSPSLPILSPIPTSARWSYSFDSHPPRSVPRERSCSPSPHGGGRGMARGKGIGNEERVSLYPSVNVREDGSIELLREDYLSTSSISVGSSPTISLVRMHVPQRAVYHRSMSAEGEELQAGDMSDQGHGR
ncbi:hypothetical protein M231_04834 [Tremella mesenterica]|uniref:Uncharacterized protein n=1 Tax=Tremella mesenterica TaxID=5217 RepID=A0A4Q1BJL6_TREME|nr:uncharacterized protein TREMEDRAFT_66249 [Tremella mesenterica DSM 1558]EIW65882.1 hypothetical protein TREMEDRAFT_66249 [Tremella mesenterica DSM 1558]RXK37836.1 hypothetical protein M231_04834 [Tremella mesenterica]